MSGMSGIFRFGVYEIDVDARELRREGRLVRMPPQAFRLLVALVSAPGEVVGRDQLRAALWPDNVHVDFERSLNTAVRKLRVALHEDADHPRYVQTLPGHGYRFIAPVLPPQSQLSRPSQPPPLQPQPLQPQSLQARHLLSQRAPRSRTALLIACAAATATLVFAAASVAFWNAAGAGEGRDRETRIAARAEVAAGERALVAYRLGKAVTGERMSELTRSIEAFEEAVRIDPRFAPAWAALARARASRAVLDGRDGPELRLARLEAERALATDNALADAHLALGQVRFALDDDAAGAEIDLRRARALGATAGRDQFWLVRVLLAEGRIDSALRILDEALITEPRSAQLHAWRGLILHAARRYDEELVELTQATALDADSWEAALQLGLGYSRRRQYDLALPALRRAVALSDGIGLSVAWLGRVSADAGDIASAEQALHQLRDIAPSRGIAPSLAASIEYHLAARRQQTKSSN
jgi:DNA-binding winged helix-turn-helix (wHTH) protein/tetratricopeptide (TPR) repeat protein